MTDQHPLTDEIFEQILKDACYAEAERIIDQRCRARFLYPHSHRPLMIHPLTDDKCRTVADSMTDFDGFPDAHDHMRAGADWQLEQVLNWINETIIERGCSFEAINIPEELEEAMRPTTQEDN